MSTQGCQGCTAFSQGCCKNLMKGEVLDQQEIYIDGLGFLKAGTVVIPYLDINRRLFWCQTCKNEASRLGSETPTTQEMAKLILNLKDHYERFLIRYCTKDKPQKEKSDPVVSRFSRLKGGGRPSWDREGFVRLKSGKVMREVDYDKQQAFLAKEEAALSVGVIYIKHAKQLVEQQLFQDLYFFQQQFLEAYLKTKSEKEKNEFLEQSMTLKEEFDKLKSWGLIRIKEL